MHQSIHQESCLHLALNYGFENVVTMDIDEVLIPHSDISGKSNSTYIDLVEMLDAKYENAAMYSFSNMFSPFLVNGGFETEKFELLGIRNNIYLDINENHQRSKTIYKPHRMSETTTHGGKALSTFERVLVDPDIAVTHHFRRGPRHAIPEFVSESLKTHTDTTIKDRYGDQIVKSALYRNVEAWWNNRNFSGYFLENKAWTTMV